MYHNACNVSQYVQLSMLIKNMYKTKKMSVKLVTKSDKKSGQGSAWGMTRDEPGVRLGG